MSILIKPDVVYKGQDNTFSLSKNELASLQLIFNDSYFQNHANWMKVVFNYKSSSGNQIKTIEFDASNLNPTGIFFASPRARDVFELQSIHIIDFDHQIFIVPRSHLDAQFFDLELNVNMSSSSLVLLEDGGVLLTEDNKLLSIE
jgi:hypothetical protein